MLIDRHINEDETETPDVNNNFAENPPETPDESDSPFSVDTHQAPRSAQSCEVGSVEDFPEAARSCEADFVEDEVDPMEVHDLNMPMFDSTASSSASAIKMPDPALGATLILSGAQTNFGPAFLKKVLEDCSLTLLRI